MAGGTGSKASINPLILANGWRGEGRRVALATVIRTWGASPRPVGSMLVADDQGDFAGSVSGGCIESEVVMAAAEAIAANASRVLDFGIDNDDAWSAGLTCGGSLQVLVQPVADDAACLSPAIIERCAEALTRREPLGLMTNLVSMRPRLVEWADAETLPDEFRNRLTSGRAGLESREQADWFIQPLRPAPTLAIVGAVHVAQPLARIAVIAGLDVVVIDPRRAFADSDNLRGIDVRGEWPGEALAGLAGGGGIAVATLTHEPRLDDPALNWALTNDDVFYIGALGSRRTHAARLERLREQGFEADQLARIHAPIGLDIKALTPEEIAVSILAELVAVRRGARD